MAASDLINSLISGDERAFKMVVDTNASMIFRVIMNFGVSREDAEDLSQEVFMDAFRNIRTFRSDAEISTWLYRIA
ncbi:MAG TPA: sigma factor, partial [Bacteroidales bacterium]|nr:sigma factor [Bacteroidales bacterium]